ncbi:MAG TPA: phytanoyl-CoA dioxygenase family protein [Pseudomonadales bacterium]|nr:phytanoyl-CoA dioxygenase family protein [Pseudomonadales bacterium]
MSDAPPLLGSRDMARFVARGFLRFDGLVPDAINRDFLDAVGPAERRDGETLMQAYGRLIARSDIPEIRAGVPFEGAFDAATPLGRLFALPAVRGIVRSLVGAAPRFDHQFLHVAFPPSAWREGDPPQMSQHLHQDSTIDPRRDAFDIQLMYYPHAVGPEDGGTRFVPGSHLRIVSEAAIARYQNVLGQQHMVCPAGTLLVLHHGIWHGGGINRGTTPRTMYKIRLNPSVRQTRLWDTSDLPADLDAQRPIFWRRSPEDPEHVHAILARQEPWYENDTGRLELLARARLWRAMLGDAHADVDYWLTRVENRPGPAALA